MPADTPGKTPDQEAFPVASRLLAPAMRAPVLAFYRFARLADDVADAPGLPPEAKLRRLDELEAALLAGDPASPEAAGLAAVQREHGTGVDEARQLLSAFRQDAGKARYRDWDDLLDYCRRSADPVGRFLLRLHGEAEPANEPADALCTALQILNHLQDLERDKDGLDRVYLPLPWLERVGGEAAFFAPDAAGLRRPVLDTALDQVDGLLALAESLPGAIRSSRLRGQAVATLACGRKLARRLRRADPILSRVTLGSRQLAAAILQGLVGMRSSPRPDAAITRGIVHRSGSSFRLGMASLRAERRRAMYALYAFCRSVDDAADGAAPPAERLRFLGRWRAELDGPPRTPVGRELLWARQRFALPEPELHLLLDGMTIDAAEPVRLADEAGLRHYWRAVAGTVGLLSVRIFGAKGADAFALHLAQALQLVNILRDVEEDAARNRVYLPRSRLTLLGIQDGEAAQVIADPGFGRAWAELAEAADAAFAAAETALEELDRRTLRPALLMLWSYRPLLERLRRRGWQLRQPRPRLTTTERLRLAAWMTLGRAA